MNGRFYYIIIALFLELPTAVNCQPVRPVSPLLTHVTVEQSTGKPILQWDKSPSPGVAGYVVYYFSNGEGHAFDTIRDPNATSYVNLGSSCQFFIESYVVAALDSAGNVSPLSNELHTMLPLLSADSCQRKINASWNSYPSFPVPVTGYTISVSEDGGLFTGAGTIPPDQLSFDLGGIKPAINYCILITANLEGGGTARSVIKCKTVDFERGPGWMNADDVSVTEDKKLELHFTFDPLFGGSSFFIRRTRLSTGEILTLPVSRQAANEITYTDATADITQEYSYQIFARNNCGIASWSSNVATNLVVDAKYENNQIRLRWNSYKEFTGGVNSYEIYIDTGDGFSIIGTDAPPDTIYSLDYNEIMNSVTGGKICLYTEAREKTNIHGISGVSRSNTSCIDAVERITVPNAFTPNNDNLNDLFRPVLSFTPVEYRLMITDRQNNKLFETTDPMESWDGTRSGSALPADIYLWFIRLKTPSGREITKTGTVAIVKTR